MLDRIDDTIVAVSSAPGYGPIGIVRMSGPDTMPLLERMSRLSNDRPLSECRGFSRLGGEVYFDDSGCGLPATILVFRAPRSYTCQDLAEIHLPGVPVALNAVRDRAIRLGAIHAQPGEFTARAFLNGRLSLTQAEGVAHVIRAQTDTQLRAARRMMDGDLAVRISTVRDKLAELLALIEADIDFAEEPIEFITPKDLSYRLHEAGADLDDLASPDRSLEQMDTLPHVLLLGPPNAGKSTLMNRLSKTDRAICAAVAGTTRDLLAAPIEVGGQDAILLDSAGIDEGRSGLDARSQAAALDRARSVDVVCVVIDATRPVPEAFLYAVEAAAPARIVVALNKIDAAPTQPNPPSDSVSTQNPAPMLRYVSFGSAIPAEGSSAIASSTAARLRALGPTCAISAMHGYGLDELDRLLRGAIGASPTTERGEAVVLTARQNEAIHATASAIGRAIALSEGSQQVIDSADLLAFEVREAVDLLGTITGDVSTEDLLNRIFADFCIGK